MKCGACGGILMVERPISTAGWLCILAGLVFTPFCVGVPVLIAGCFIREERVRCQSCRQQNTGVQA